MSKTKAQPIETSVSASRVRAEQMSPDGLEYRIWTFDVEGGALVPCWVHTRTRDSKKHDFRILSQNLMNGWDGVPLDESRGCHGGDAHRVRAAGCHGED